jgi:putative peptidoglycan lipid II flippase
MSSQIVRSTLLVSALNLCGKILGLLKNLLIAAVFGASWALDAFWVAYLLPFAIPSILRGIAASAFIPRFMLSLAGPEPDWRGANTFFTAMLLITACFSSLFFFGAEQVVSLTAPSLEEKASLLAADMIQYFALAMLVLGGSAVLTSLSFALEQFTVPALESFITNSVIILAALLLVESFGIYGLVWGVIGGLFLQFASLVWSTRHHIVRHLRLDFALRHPDFLGAMSHVGPLLLGYAGATLMSIIDQVFASTLPSGTISILSYAVMLAFLPLEVFGEAVMTTFYPALSRYYARRAVRPMMAVHLRGLRLLLILLLPLTVMLVLFGETIVSVLFEHGEFNHDDVMLTAATISALVLGLVFRATTYFNFRVFHAMTRPWFAVSIGFIGVALNASLNWLLIGPLGLQGIALASSLAMMVSCSLSAWMLFRVVRCGMGGAIMRRIKELLLRLSAACVVSFVPFYLLLQQLQLNVWLQIPIIMLAVLLFAIALVYLRVPEAVTLRDNIMRRLKDERSSHVR